MSTKPKSAKTTATPKAPTSLYNAVRDRLKAQDADTLHARTQKAVEAFESYLGGKPLESEATQVPVTSVVDQAAPAPWSLEGLVVDPDPKESVGKVGIFWDSHDSSFNLGVSADPEDSCRVYTTTFNEDWDHFAYLPGNQLEELFKRTTGHVVPK